LCIERPFVSLHHNKTQRDMTYALYQENEIIETGSKAEMTTLLEDVFNEAPELREFANEYEIKPLNGDVEESNEIEVRFVEKNGVTLCKNGRKVIGYITESVREGVGFGYSFDKPSQLETMVFYSNKGYRTLEEAKAKFVKVINEELEIA